MFTKKIAKAVFASLVLASSTTFLSGCGCAPQATPTVDRLEIWGLFDNSEVYNKAITAYLNAHKNVKDIVYKKKTCNEPGCADYIRELTNALAAQQGPDIFMISNTWVPAQKDKMLTLDDVNAGLVKAGSDKIMTLRELQDTFVPVVKKDLTFPDPTGQEKIYALPLYMDDLAVFYNQDIMNASGVTPPAKNWSWEDFSSYATKMTKIDEYGGIQRAGASIGYGKNVDRSTDILSILMMQMGSPIIDENWNSVLNNRVTSQTDGTSFSPGERALAFYTSFASRAQTVYSWNKEQWNSIDAFNAGKVGMMIDYSHMIANIKAKAPNLNMGIAYLPQLKSSPVPINFASYWAMSVSKQAAGQKAIEAWNFLKFLTDKDQATDYSKTTGRVSARYDVIVAQKEDPLLGVFADQASSATSFRQPNDARVAKIFEDGINSIVEGLQTPTQASANMSQQLSQEGYLIQQKIEDEKMKSGTYGVSK